MYNTINFIFIIINYLKAKSKKEINKTPNQTHKTVDVQNQEVPARHVNYSYDASTLEAVREWSWAFDQSGTQTLSQKTNKGRDGI